MTERSFRDKEEAMKLGLICKAITACLLGLLATLPCRGASADQFKGLLSAKLSPYKAWKPQHFFAISDDQAAEIGIELGKGQKAFIGKLDLDCCIYPAVMVEGGQQPEIYIDADLNNSIDPGEHLRFAPYEDRSKEHPSIQASRGGKSVGAPGDFRVTVPLPLPSSHFGSFPLILWRFQPPQERAASLLVTYEAESEGIATVNGHQVRLIVKVAADGKVKKQWFGMDCNGDGKVDRSAHSTEADYTQDEEAAIIFRVGNTYVSVDTIDSEAGTVGLKEHPPGDYHWQDLRVGAEVADFRFKDLEGTEHSVSGFRGKYVLLYLWRADWDRHKRDIPVIRQLQSKLGDSLQVIGIESGSNEAVVRSAANVGEFPWLQSSPDSTAFLWRWCFRLDKAQFPIFFFLGPDRRVLANSAPGRPTTEGLSKILKGELITR